MAQTGFTPLIHYNSGTTGHVPSSVNLVAGEIAINYFDGSLFYLDNTSTVQRFGGITQTAGVTGAGANVLATSPVLVTPNLGTPSALVATNVTGTAAGLSIGGNAATATNVAYSGLTGTVPTWNQNTTGNAATATLATTATTATTANALNPANTYSVSGMNGGQLAGLRNRIINGDMSIAQRGTSFVGATNYTLDRWSHYYAGTPCNVAQVAGPTGYAYAMQITGVAGNTNVNVEQKIESRNCVDLVGKTIVISCNLQASAAQTVLWQLFYANSADNFGVITGFASGTWNVTTTATEFSIAVASLPAGAANGLLLALNPNNGAGFTSGTINITGVQLEVADPVNPVATPFEQRPIGLELALCQRYYEISQALPAAAFNSSATVVIWNFTVQKRAAPTITLPTVGLVVGNGGSLIPTLAGVSFNSPQSATFELTVSGGVAGFAYFWREGLVAASAEL